MRRSVLVVVLLLVASACSSGTGAETTVEGGGDDTTATTAAEATSTATDVSTDSASCVGVWELDSAAFFENYNETASAQDEIAFVEGKYLVTWIADGTFTDRRVDWTFEFPGVEDAGAMIMNSIGAGRWQVVDGENIVTDYELTDPQVSMIVDGEVLELPVAPGSLPGGIFDDRATVVCTESTMSMFAGGYESTLIRVG